MVGRGHVDVLKFDLMPLFELCMCIKDNTYLPVDLHAFPSVGVPENPRMRGERVDHLYFSGLQASIPDELPLEIHP